VRLDNGMQLALGRQQTDARLARFVALYPRLFGAQPTAKAVANASADAPSAAPSAPVTVDLRYSDGFAVRMPDGVSPFKPSET
jgi:cell division protein FtsQ